MESEGKARDPSIIPTWKSHLRDPIWQSVSVALTVILAVLPFVWSALQKQPTPEVTRKEPAEIKITSADARVLSEVPSTLAPRFKILVDNKQVEDVHLLTYFFIYKGDQPIKPENFITPFVGSVDENRQILGIEKSAKIPVPYIGYREGNAILSQEWADRWQSTVSSRNSRPIDVSLKIGGSTMFENFNPTYESRRLVQC